MYVFLNALKNIARNKGRNFLIGSIIFVLITVSVISLCINNTTAAVINDYKTRFGSEVTISADLLKLNTPGTVTTSTGVSVPSITADQYLSFAKSEYLKEYSLIAKVSAGGDDFKAVDEDANTIGGNAGFTITGSSSGVDYVMPKLTLVANQTEDFSKGLRKLLDGGKMPEKTGECAVSSEFAELNGYKVGDSIHVVTTSYKIEDGKTVAEEVSADLTITGIYLDGTEAYPSVFKMASMNRRNEVLTTMDTLTEKFKTNLSITAKYYLKDPSMLKNFEAELRSLGLDDYYKVSTDEAGYQKVVGPVEGLKKMSLTFLIVVLAFGAIILLLLSTIAIRERKYEIGVLRAMGMKKHKVALGLWSEMLIITALCLCLGFGVGTLAAQPVGDALLADQIKNTQTTSQSTGFTVISLDGSKDYKPLDKVNVSVGAETILEIGGIALLLASFASVTAIVAVTKFEPIKILMERN